MEALKNLRNRIDNLGLRERGIVLCDNRGDVFYF